MFNTRIKNNKKPDFLNYFSINKKAYGKNNNKGGLLIIIKNIFKEFTREILIPDLDMMGIQFTDYVIINIYKRHDRNVEINKKIFNVLQKYQNHKTIIGGDFNLKDNDIKIFSILNFKITLNNKPSRKDNNLDYFISNFNNLQFKRKVLNIRKEDYKLYSLIYKLFENNELIQEIKDRNRKKYLKLLDQINTEFENNENFWKKLNKFRQTSSKMILNNKNLEKTYFGFVNSITVLHSQLLYGLEIFDLTENDFKEIDTWINKKVTKFLLKINPHSPRLIYKTEAKIDSVRITIYKRKYKLIQKLNFLGFEKLIKLLPFREKESENINWKSKTLKDLELELDNYRINQLKNSPSWKVRKYLKIVTIQGNINKQQKYLKWKGSTSILKLRTFTNYLNRYSYVMNEDKSKFCKLCKKINNLDIIEDLDHFLWNCPAYENNRKIWISELKNINISHILKNNNISNIIDRKDSITLLALVENKSIWKSLKKLLNHNLGIRANKRN
ncbi:signal recognition particle 19 kda protein [Anaeramoeba flamelloides]|uniref:Signal recognition particle 19 kDa protein n=1 Tax=Anaeramoeba flamelloides TaxID=1746091 RepID=A0ABQ8X140_9EUKA|nr:signal recognition particle 19 kda protein [Anaeramoeba flamelloides]